MRLTPSDGLEPTSDDQDSTFVDYLAGVQDCIRRGEAVDVDAEVDAHPEWAGRIRSFFPVLEMMNELETPSQPDSFDSFLGTLGDFRTVREIGRGGMGVVYEAEQLSLTRRVALKILRRVDTRNPIKVRRFQIEAQAAACLKHEHIVPVFTFGREGPVHFYAMRLIEGNSLADLISKMRKSGGRIDFRKAAQLALDAAEALHYAHEQGIIHRDVKPSNLLIESTGWLWVADFGLARMPGNSELTGSGVLMGTLRYTSPEQALGSRGVVDHRTDIYALGATLYEMLTLRPAFTGDGRVELLREIAEVEPRSPRKIDPTIPVDLETIALKALSKNPSDRYSTAKEFADDLARFIGHRPILARPPGVLGTATRWCRRHRPFVFAAALFVAATAAGLFAASVWRESVLRVNNRALTSALDRAKEQEAATRRLWHGSQTRIAHQEFEAGAVEFAQDILERLRPGPGETDLRGFEWSYLRRIAHEEVSVLFGHQASVYALALSKDARTLVSGDKDGLLIFWDLDRWQKHVQVQETGRKICGLSFSPDGAAVASVSRPVAEGREPFEIRLWDPKDGKRIALVPTLIDKINGVSFNEDGRTLIVHGERNGEAGLSKEVEFWKLTPWGTLASTEPTRLACGMVCLSSNPSVLATSDDCGNVVLRDTSSGRVITTIEQRFTTVPQLAFTPDGKTLAVNQRGKISFWELGTGKGIGKLRLSEDNEGSFHNEFTRSTSFPIRHERDSWVSDPRTLLQPIRLEDVVGVPIVYAFAPDGKTVAAGGVVTPATIWDLSTGKKRAHFPVNMVNVHCMTYTPDAKSLIFAGEDARIRFWHFDRPAPPRDNLKGHNGEAWSLVYSKGGESLISSGDDHAIKVWEPCSGDLKATLEGHRALVASIALSPDGKTLASAGFEKEIRLWNLPDGTLRAILKGHEDRVRTVAFSADGSKIATGSSDFTVRLWDVASGKELSRFRGRGAVRSLAVDPRDGTLVAGDDDRKLRIFDPETLEEKHEPVSCRWPISTVAYSPDGSTFAAGDDEGNVTLWDTESWSERMKFRVSDATVWSLTFSPDGRTIATGCDDAKVRILSPVTGQVVLVLNGHRERVNAVTFSPDGKTLASASHDGSISLWNAVDPDGSMVKEEPSDP